MLLGGLEIVLLALLLGGAAIALAMISIAAVMEVIYKYWDDLDDEVLIIDPKASSELAKIAKQKGSKKHKRFVYNPVTREALLVESNSISNQLEDEDVVYITI
ncbi:hypothetical protein IQ224_16230 [Microcystis sp. LEGE 00066]|uniref:hypothetical protein n=1 Tax=Microcystis sp. LEGE 00066 TaxID=1828685 RepID=UPI001882DD6D|nr:hypothetical protein [Microcystis sp. LEGE 00066]MBE9263642.1 hypothetical protein [Microcystis sp. LEGE 00066]